MHFNSSVFYALMCLSIILRTASGSPVPPSRPAQGSPAPPNPSASHVEPAGPVFSIGLPKHDPRPRPRNPPLQAPFTSRELTALIAKFIEAGLKFYAPRELGSFIPELHTHPHRHIQFVYPRAENLETYVPLPAYIHNEPNVLLGTIQRVGYNFTFKPGLQSDATTIDFWGFGVLRLISFSNRDFKLADAGMNFKVFEKVDGSLKASPDNPLLVNHIMTIEPCGQFRFSNTIPGDRSGRGLEDKRMVLSRSVEGRTAERKNRVEGPGMPLLSEG
ncbi:hypothetical protein EV360DRAFT_77008 [Lentinula raphanica]|nr:hypothetical protein EV360DRAFT_77008 [Lentinula raphanica]